MGGIHIKNKWLPYVLVAPTVILICVFKLFVTIWFDYSYILFFLFFRGGIIMIR